MATYLAEETAVVLGELENAIAEGREIYGTSNKLFWRSLQSIRLEVEHRLGGLSVGNAAQIVQAALEAYWNALQRTYGAAMPFHAFQTPERASLKQISSDAMAVTIARGLGRFAAQSEPVTASYWLGEIYTQLLPGSLRAQFGVYYTPPALTTRLITSLRSCGVDWSSARIIDPACGGGAFLAPVALEIRRELGHLPAEQLLQHIADHVRGYEIDPFGAWMSQVMLEATLYDLCISAGHRLSPVVETVDALTCHEHGADFDVVIGNPPYGRVTLPRSLRDKYERSVYGHANLYGLFMDLAVRLAAPGALIAYVTPTSFLGGQYFRNLRALMMQEAPPVLIDLVSSRKGVFTDVLQETLMAIYQRSATRDTAHVCVVELVSESDAIVEAAGKFAYPKDPLQPWLLPRNLEHRQLIDRMRAMPHRLRDYGYKVSTGPLVWNRHKPQLRKHPERTAYPIVWAESITRDGRFAYRTDKKNHLPFLQTGPKDDWLITRQPCVLVQRTTAKEQHRRLIAAELPQQFINQYGGVCVENHLNMVRPSSESNAVSTAVVAALLNSATVDQVFRCISGSVAVSASELEALPLPPPENAAILADMIERGAIGQEIDDFIYELYMSESVYVPA